tara:strand:- start:9747 stop:10598 length:852 start_codon:yes stop_codon:yes gene_type:complete
MSSIKKVYQYKIGGKYRGMFSVINELLEIFYRADSDKINFLPVWNISPYSIDWKENTFEYYFENNKDKKNGNYENLPTSLLSDEKIRVGSYNPKTTIEQKYKKTRELFSKIIKDNLHLKTEILNKINLFKANNFSEIVIGLHIRGQGGIDGVGKLRKIVTGSKNKVPFDLYFDKVNELLKLHPNAKVFVCSDSSTVKNYCIKQYKDRIITYNSTTSRTGEMHRRAKFTKYKKKLGEDIIIEAYLMAMTNYLIHGNSNVTNFVLCKNYELESFNVYEPYMNELQ